MGEIAETLNSWCSASGIKFVNDTAKANYLARAKRISDVIQLKKPDRVPVIPSFGMFPALYNGISVQEAMYKPEKAANAWLKTVEEFKPDAMMPPAIAFPGKVYDILKYKPLKIPGYDVPKNHIYQFEEKEYIKAEEFYDAYLNDPTSFMLKNFFPTVCGALEALKKLPQFLNMYSYNAGILDGSLMMAQQGIAEAFQTWAAAGQEASIFLNKYQL